MSILEPTEEQKQGYLARLPKAEVFGDEILAGLVASSQKILSVKDFPLDENDILIASYPKSGSTWVSALVSAIAHEGDIETLKAVSHEQRIPWLELDDKFLPESSPLHSSRIANAGPSSKKRVWFTHLHAEYLPISAKQGKCKIIYVARNPKDNAVNFFNYHQTTKFLGLQSMSWDDYLPLFTSGFITSGSWFKHAKAYWKLCENNANAKFVTFEDLQRHSVKEISGIENFIGIPLSDDTRTKVIEHCGIIKGEIGEWKKFFKPNQNEAFNKLYEKEVGGTGLYFEFE